MAEMKKILVHENGGPEVIQLADVPIPSPEPGEVLVRNHAIGVNFIDTYHRSGLYKLPLPTGLGKEGAGVVTEIGEGVDSVSVGDRVAYIGPPGAYAEYHKIKADRIVSLSDGVSFEQAAAMMLKGLTAQYLIRRIYPVNAGETVLFHAVAGGVGSIAVQWLKSIGATVIGTAGSEAKADRARALGCDHVILYEQENVAERVMEITDGAKVPVVFDGVGASTWESSLDSLQVRGLMVSYGNASGPVTGINLGILTQKGSLFVTRPMLDHYTRTRQELQDAADDLFAVIASGEVKVDVNHRYTLAEVARAHRDLEARKTTGSSILTP